MESSTLYPPNLVFGLTIPWTAEWRTASTRGPGAVVYNPSRNSSPSPFKAGQRDRWMTREEYPAAIWEHLCLLHVLSGWNSLGMTLRNPSLSQHLRNVAYPVSNSLLAGPTDQLKIIWRPPIFNFIILDLKSRIRQHHAYGDIKWIWHAVGYMISRLQTATKVMTL